MPPARSAALLSGAKQMAPVTPERQSSRPTRKPSSMKRPFFAPATPRSNPVASTPGPVHQHRLEVEAASGRAHALGHRLTACDQPDVGALGDLAIGEQSRDELGPDARGITRE
jgi:hypothetical protein